MSPRLPLLASVLFIAAHLPMSAQDKGTHNDQIYPPEPAAKSAINFDGKGFIINGKRTFLSSGSIHHPRVPRELWDDRMLRMQQANFNCIETYAFWNLNEPQENTWDFSNEKDIGGFFDLAKQHGLYGIARVGPYVCAEWDLGGYPVWLKFKPEMNVRTNDPAFLALNDHWYEKIVPIIAKRQINHGGNIVLVQLENEHPQGWGVIPNDPYFVHVRDSALKQGLEVPHFMSGLHHGGPPGSENVDPTKRSNPWFSTEFWSGWFDAYRTLQVNRERNIDLTHWAIVAHGAGGLNFYMVHGGTNFETWNDDSVGSSYDYGTAIGQTGDLRLMYYRMKRVNQLAQSFPSIFADSTDELANYKDFANGAEILGARKSDTGTFVFLRNGKADAVTATLKNGEHIKLAPRGTYPLPQQVALATGITLTNSNLAVLALASNGDTSTLVIYGEPGENGSLNLAATGSVKPGAMTQGVVLDSANPSAIKLAVTIPTAGIEECHLDVGSRTLRVLAIPRDLTLYTWMLGETGKQHLVFGPGFVRELKITNGTPSLIIERTYGQAASGQVAVYGGRGESWHLAAKADTTLDDQAAPSVTAWEQSIAPQSAPQFNDSAWKTFEQPGEMGLTGNTSAFAWYRTTVDLPTAGTGKLNFKVGDDAQVILNGAPLATGKNNATGEFIAGKNTIAILVSHHGRNKAFNYRGSLTHHGDKGLLGAPSLEIGGTKRDLTGWRLSNGLDENPTAITTWKSLANTTAGSGLPSFYRTHFTAKPPGQNGAYPILRATFAGLSRGTMWINGHSLGRYPEKIRIDSLYIPECWLNPSGENTLTVFDETGAAPTQVKIVVEKIASREVMRLTDSVAANAPIVVPAENPPRDLVAMNKGNLLFKKAATASASKNGSSPASATDGDTETLWNAPEKTVPVSLQGDLGDNATVKTLEIVWNWPAKHFKYVVDGSTDGTTWTKLGDNTTAVPTSPDSPSELSRLNLNGGPVRFLRVTVTEMGKYTVGIAELRAYGADK